MKVLPGFTYMLFSSIGVSGIESGMRDGSHVHRRYIAVPSADILPAVSRHVEPWARHMVDSLT